MVNDEVEQYKDQMVKAEYLDWGNLKSITGVLTRFTARSVWIVEQGQETKIKKSSLDILEVFDGEVWHKTKEG